MTLVRRLTGGLLLLAFGLWTSPASAVIIYGNPVDTGRNLASEEAIPFDLGQYVAPFAGALGTPISATHFVTAQHTGGTPTFTFGGETFNVEFVDNRNDLAVWKISEAGKSFARWAPLYTDSAASTVGKSLVVIGRGTERGSEIKIDNVLHGWNIGGGGGEISWGTNKVSSVFTLIPAQYPGLEGFAGDLLRFTFDAPGQGDNAGSTQSGDEGFLSGGDSGGVVFVRDADGTYKLAGVNSLTDQVNGVSGGDTAIRALFDARGFFNGTELIGGALPVPVGSYATSISSRLDFLGQFAPVPEPSSIVLIGMAACGGAAYGWRRRTSGFPA